MEQNVNNPLVVRCEYCAGDLFFDITKQRYCCSHCGAEASVADKRAEYRQWRSIRKEAVMKDIAKVKSFKCPACGAETIAAGEEVTALCPFCQNTMIDSRFAGNDLPEVIIPFRLSHEEAEARLREWLKQNQENDTAKVIEANMKNFSGCYLPFHIVRGAYSSYLQIRLQNGSHSNYPFLAYMDHTLVNASKELNNLFLDGIEPFDFNDALQFDFGHLNHQKAKVQNIGGQELEARIDEETGMELYRSLSKKMRTKELSVLLNDDRNETIPALLPVYLVKCDYGICAAVNGQTGKISVDTGKQHDLTGRWWVAPTIATLTVAIVAGYFGGFAMAFMGALVFGMVFFAVAHTRHHKEMAPIILTYPKEKEKHNDTRVEFFADFGKGPVPCLIKFFTPMRIINTVIIILAVIFLPVLIAIPIQLMRGLPLSTIQIGYGAAWYCVPGFMSILAAGGLAKTMMYGAPIYYEILPNGKTKRRKLKKRPNKTSKQKNIQSPISQSTPSPINQSNPSQKNQANPSQKKLFPDSDFKLLSGQGCLVIGFILFLLIGSIAAMIS